MTTNNTYAFSSKWSPRLKPDGFTEIPNTLIKNQGKLGITDAEMVVIVSLSLFKWDRRLAFPAVSTLSEHTGKTSGAIRGNIRSLEKKGYIKRIFRPNEPNQYDLRPLVKILESYAQPTKKVTPRSHKLNTPLYQNIDTKEYEANNTKRIRPRDYSGKPAAIGQIIRTKRNYGH